jgi:hypothetical protein
MNTPINSQNRLHRVTASAWGFLLLGVFGGLANGGDALPGKTSKESVDEAVQKANLRAGVKALSEGRQPSADGGAAAAPSAAAFAAMDDDERRSFASAAAKICDKFAEGLLLGDTEVAWMKRGLPFLRVSDGGHEEKGLAERVYRDMIGLARNLAQLRQAEAFSRAVYPAMAACGKAEPGGFDRTRLKKELVRKRLAMLKGDAP